MAGLFITFEGGEGTGKSTQAKRIADHYRKAGRTVVLTREPGGTEQGEAVRNLLVNGDPERWSPTAEALLNSAARDAHVRDVIRPALARGEMVISDRFMDSTRAYQGYAGKCSMEFLDALEHQVVGNTRPELKLIFDLDPAIGLLRAKSRGAGIEDRYERKGHRFHDALRQGFIAIAAANPARCRIIDASQSEADVYASVLSVIEAKCHG
jgi:dTMP kinase